MILPSGLPPPGISSPLWSDNTCVYFPQTEACLHSERLDSEHHGEERTSLDHQGQDMRTTVNESPHGPRAW